MTYTEAIEEIKLAIAEVEWEYPMEYTVAFEMAIKALKKQIPYRPKEYEDRYYSCKCGNVLMIKWNKYPIELNKCGLPYCLNCGQAIDWSDVD